MAKENRRMRARKKAKKHKRTSLLPWIIVSVGLIFVACVGWNWASQRARAPSVGIVDQFYSQSPGFTDGVVRFLEEHDITCKVHKDAEVTVELYRNLPTFGYKLIILRVHVGVSQDPRMQTALFTSEEYSLDKYYVEQMLDQVGSGRFEGLENPVFTVSPKFVIVCMKEDFRKTTIILSSCWGLHNTFLAEGFVERGALSFIGWDERVTLEHTDNATLALLKGLIGGRLTIKEAVDKVMEDVGPDQFYSSKLKYYPKEASSLKLKP